MTRRITVSLPDDVAAYLDSHPNSSAVVADAVRARMARGEAVAATLREIGMELTDEGRAWARSVLRRPTEAQQAESQRYLEALEAGHLPDPA
jgi:predicted transcriptional regulator